MGFREPDEQWYTGIICAFTFTKNAKHINYLLCSKARCPSFVLRVRTRSIPSRRNHQINRNVNWYRPRADYRLSQFARVLWLFQQSFLYRNIYFRLLLIVIFQSTLPHLPLGPFKLSIQPGKGSVRAAVTIEGLTITRGSLCSPHSHRFRSNCSPRALL